MSGNYYENVKQPSVMKHDFSKVPHADIQRSSFNRSHGLKTTMDSSYLVPIFIDEVLPGDTFNLNVNLFARLATPLTPFMDNLFLDTFFFFVPNRLIWDNWERFNGAQDNPNSSVDYLIPTATSPVSVGYANSSLQDYFGIPTQVAGIVHNNLPFRAYNLIYNEWFRDENLQNSIPVPKGDGPDSVTDFVLRKRGKRHDYFTSCLPWPQKGTAVGIGFSGNAPVLRDSNAPGWTGYTGGTDTPTTSATLGTAGSLVYSAASPNPAGLSFDPNGGLVADLSSVTATTINDIRMAVTMQQLLERDARGGTRYTEIIRSHFGVVSPDARLQRPEYLGGSSTAVNINPVAQTSGTGIADQESPQGTLTAVGTANLRGHGFVKSFTEHGYIIGLANVRADLNYQYGLNKLWSRSTRYDFYWPTFANLGEQAVLNKEIYAQGTAGGAADAAVFGYQERYAEYRYKPSIITGQMRSNFAQSLDIWHLAEEYNTLPTLSSSFIEDSAATTVDRVIVTQDYPQWLVDGYFKLICARPMPVYSVPGLLRF